MKNVADIGMCFANRAITKRQLGTHDASKSIGYPLSRKRKNERPQVVTFLLGINIISSTEYKIITIKNDRYIPQETANEADAIKTR